MSNIVINQVYLEDDLSLFKTLVGNRDVLDSRVMKIKDSIQSVGMIDAPIVCNEKMEVIDGQGRLQACRELGKPVPYIVIPGLTIEHCRAMNINQEKWKTLDYIKSFAAKRNDNYIWLLDFIENTNFLFIIKLNIAFNGYNVLQRKALLAGNAVFSEEARTAALSLASWLRQFDAVETNNCAIFYDALRFCYNRPEVNNSVLVKKILNSPNEFKRIAKLTDCIETIEHVYNRRSREHIYISHLYDVWLRERGINNAMRKATGRLFSSENENEDL